MLLAGDDQRVHDAAAVVDEDVAQRLHLAGLDVDLDDRDVGAERERRAVLGVVGVDAEAAVVLVGVRRQLRATRPRTSGTPATPEAAVVERDVRRRLASSIRAATARALSRISSAALLTALPPSCSDREPPVPPPVRTTAVSDCR